MSETVKTSFNINGKPDIRRVTLTTGGNNLLNQVHSFLYATYFSLFPSIKSETRLSLRYDDGEDLCSISSELELIEALRLAKQHGKVLKLEVSMDDNAIINNTPYLPSSIPSREVSIPVTPLLSSGGSYESNMEYEDHKIEDDHVSLSDSDSDFPSDDEFVRVVGISDNHDVVLEDKKPKIDSTPVEATPTPVIDSVPASEPVTIESAPVQVQADVSLDNLVEDVVDTVIAAAKALNLDLQVDVVPEQTTSVQSDVPFVTVEDEIEEKEVPVISTPVPVENVISTPAPVVDTATPVSSPAPVSKSDEPFPVVHERVTCDICGVHPIIGVRYKCTVCSNYDLCSTCESSGVHPSNHGLLKIKIPLSWEQSQRYEQANSAHRHAHYGRRHHGHRHPHHSHDQDGHNCSSGSDASEHRHSHRHHKFGGFYRGIFDRIRNWHTHAAQAESAESNETGSGRCPFYAHGHRHHDRDAGHTHPGHCTRPRAQFIGDVTLADGLTVQPGSTLNKVWSIKNVGAEKWPIGTSLVFVGGDIEPVHGSNGNIVPVPLADPNEIVHISIDIVVPNESGRFRSTWRLQTAEGNRFGPRIWIDLIVPEQHENVTVVSSSSDSSYSSSSSTSSTSNSTSSSFVEIDSFPYASQLSLLQSMGFTNIEVLKQQLIDHKGNVEGVVAYMVANH